MSTEAIVCGQRTTTGVFQLSTGGIVTPLLTLDRSKANDNKPLHDAFRPSGINAGSGPYFSAYYNSPSGLNSYVEDSYHNLYTFNGYQERLPDASSRVWSILSVEDGQELYYSVYSPSISPIPNYFFGYYRVLGSVPHPGSSTPDMLTAQFAIRTTVPNLDAAKRLHDFYLRERRSYEEETVRSDRWVLRNFHVVNLLPESIPYKYGEKAQAEAWSLFDEVISPRYLNLMGQAYINMAEQLPQTTTNTIANVLELASLINDFRKPEFGGIGNLRDAWLGYRYQYSTTKADINEYAELTYRLNRLATAPTMKCFGSADDGVFKCTVQCTFDPSDFIPTSTKEWLRTYGMRFSLANAWDMVPYSFVADWFLPIGDFFSKLEAADDMYALTPRSIWATFSTNYEGVNTYFRCPGEVVRTFPSVTFGGSSAMTTGKRLLDTVALFVP